MGGKRHQRPLRGGLIRKQISIEPATACSPLRVRPMTAEESAAFEVRTAELERLSRTGVFECKRGVR